MDDRQARSWIIGPPEYRRHPGPADGKIGGKICPALNLAGGRGATRNSVRGAIGETQFPEAGPEEVRIRLTASGTNSGDVKKRQDAFSDGMPYPRIIPTAHDRVGPSVSTTRVEERVGCYEAHRYRPPGTPAGLVVMPWVQVVSRP
ncbi:MAG TPA: hypothetical protein VKU02_02825 [Gemmataceae bacterium]|nr:hypothetical protein [Gemmataceae bacterium]